MSSSEEDPFVNYTKPEDLQAPANKGLVAAYIGRNFRNKSTSRRSEEASSHMETSQEQKSIFPVDPGRNTSVPHLTFARSLSPFSLHYPRSGVWTDPFDALPIEQRAVIPKTMQYFMEVYAPSHLIREKHSSIWGGNTELQQYFRFAVDHKSMFSALMAISLCHIIMEEKGGIAEDGDMLFYYGIALRDVRTALSIGSPSPNDALVASVMGLMAVDILLGRVAAFDIHWRGLRRIVEGWGGMDMLRFNTIHGPVYRGLNSFWAYLMQIYEPQDSERRVDPVNFPRPPLWPSEGSNVAMVPAAGVAPSGIAQLITEELLSVPVFKFILSRAARDSADRPQASHSQRHRHKDTAHQQCLEQIAFLLAGPHLRTTDLLLCTGLPFEVLHSSAVGKFIGPYERMAFVQSRRILRTERYLESPAQRECFAYVLIVLVRAVTSTVWVTKPDIWALLSTMMEKILPLARLNRLEPILRKFCSSDAQFLRLWEPYQAVQMIIQRANETGEHVG